jgi:CSLREA domain-containing protein
MKFTFWPRGLRSGRQRQHTRSFLPRLEALESRWLPSTLTVTTSADVTDPNDGVLSLREAIAAAQSGDTISFGNGVSTVDLTQGQLVIDKSLTIKGQSKAGVDVRSFYGDSREFDVRGNIAVTLANLAIAGGTADRGGAVLNEGASLSVANCLVGGTAIGSPGGASAGGAIYNTAGMVSLSNCDIQGAALAGSYSYPGVEALGGAIYNAAGATLQLTNCSIHNSFASFVGGPPDTGPGYAAGGAIYNAGGSVSLVNTVIEGMYTSAGTSFGGAVFNADGSLSVTNCTFDRNSAIAQGSDTAAGGGIYVAGGSVQIQNSTITGNFAFGQSGRLGGGDIYVAGGSACISKNSTVGDVFGPYTLY